MPHDVRRAPERSVWQAAAQPGFGLQRLFSSTQAEIVPCGLISWENSLGNGKPAVLSPASSDLTWRWKAGLALPRSCSAAQNANRRPVASASGAAHRRTDSRTLSVSTSPERQRYLSHIQHVTDQRMHAAGLAIGFGPQQLIKRRLGQFGDLI